MRFHWLLDYWWPTVSLSGFLTIGYAVFLWFTLRIRADIPTKRHSYRVRPAIIRLVLSGLLSIGLLMEAALGATRNEPVKVTLVFLTVALIVFEAPQIWRLTGRRRRNQLTTGMIMATVVRATILVVVDLTLTRVMFRDADFLRVTELMCWAILAIVPIATFCEWQMRRLTTKDRS